MGEYWTIECKKCGESFISRTTLDNHLLKKHNINVRFKTGGVVRINTNQITKVNPEVILSKHSAKKYFKEWSSICRIYPKEKKIFSYNELIQFAEDYLDKHKKI